MDWSLQALVLLGQAFLVLTLLPWLDRQRWALIERL
jgi:hypothetical protein